MNRKTGIAAQKESCFRRKVEGTLCGLLLGAVFCGATALPAEVQTAAHGNRIAPEKPAAETKLLGFRMEKTASFADDNIVSLIVAASWAENRKATRDDDAALSACMKITDSQDRENCEGAEIIPFLRSLAGAGLDEKIAAVQVFVNERVRYTEDDAVAEYGWSDSYVAARPSRFALYQSLSNTEFYNTYAESLSFRQGDCEDYAIAKYDLLRLLGVPDSKMRIVFGLFAQPGDKPSPFEVDGTKYGGHAFLAIENESGRTMILDNDGPVSPDTNLTFIPLYAFNESAEFMTDEKDDGSPLPAIKNHLKGDTQRLAAAIPYLKSYLAP